MMHDYACQQRKVLDDGRIICSKIVIGDRKVSTNLCAACPAQTCNCQHLRFSLQKNSVGPIVVRWGNGNTEIWDDHPPVISFLHSACVLRAVPIFSARDCIGCSLRKACFPREEIQGTPQEPVPIAAQNVISVVRA